MGCRISLTFFVLYSLCEVEWAIPSVENDSCQCQNSTNVTCCEMFKANLTTSNETAMSVSEADLETSTAINKKQGEGGPQPSVSKETYDHIMPIVVLFNLVFEAVSISLTFISACVYALPNMRCATACYLVALNSADTLSGLMVVIKRTRDAIWGVTTPSSLPFAYVTLAGAVFLSVSCRRMVYCLSVMVSMERLFVIVFPLRARYIKLITYPKLCIAGLVTVVLLFHSYLLLKYQVVPSSTGVDHAIGYTEIFNLNEQMFKDVSNAAKFLFSYIPLALCLMLSVALSVALRKHVASRMFLQESQTNDMKTSLAGSAERQLAMTIWLSTILFAILSLPSNTAHLVSTFHDTFYFSGLEHRLYRLVDNFTQIPLVASRFTNFLSYLGLSTAFRRNLLRLCRSREVIRFKNVSGSQPDTVNKECSGAGGQREEGNTTISIITSSRL